MSELKDIPGVGPSTVEKLESSGLGTLMSLAVSSPTEISTVAGLSEAVARKIIKSARENLSLGFEKAKDYARKRDKIKKIGTGCSDFDDVLDGGFESSSVTEVYGRTSSGKTQLCHLMVVRALLENKDNKAIYLDSLLYNQPVFIKESGIKKVVTIGKFIDKYYNNGEDMSKEVSNIEVPTFDKDGTTSWKKVDRIYRHENKDKKYRITTKNGLSVDITSAHCLFTPTIGNKKRKRIDDIKSVMVKDLKIGEYIIVPEKIEETVSSVIDTIDVAKLLELDNVKDKYNKEKIWSTSSSFPRYIRVDKLFVEFLGWYMAEGHTNHYKTRRAVVLTLNDIKDKKAFVICKEMGEKLNISYYDNTREGETTQARLQSKYLALLIDKMFGKGAHNKRVPELIFNVKPEFIKSFIDSWLEGDGTYSVNKEMISDINYLGLLVGRRYNLYTKKQNVSTIKGRTINSAPYIYSCGKQRKNFFDYNDLFFDKIKSIEELKYKKQYVYDFCVDNNHNFLGGNGGIFVHNSESTFRPSRIKDFSESNGLNYDDVMNRIFVARSYNVDHQMLLIDELEKILQNDNNYRILVLDSLTSHFRAAYSGRGELAPRQQKLNKHLHQILKIADLYNLVVIVTNQVQSDPGQFYGNPEKPIGGNILSHSVTSIIYIRPAKAGTWAMKLVDSPNLPVADANYVITKNGFENIK